MIVNTTFNNICSFQILIKILKEILQECKIKFLIDSDNRKANTQLNNEDIDGVIEDTKENNICGIEILNFNPTHTVMIYVHIKDTSMYEYKCPNEYEIQISLDNLYKISKTLNKSQTMVMSINDNENNKLILEIKDNKNKCSKINKLKLLDLNLNQYILPEVKSDFDITMSTKTFHDMCIDMKDIGKYININCSKKELIFTCIGNETEQIISYNVVDNDEIIIKKNNKKKKLKINGTYEIAHIITFSNVVKLCDNILISISNNDVLFLKYELTNLGTMVLGFSPFIPYYDSDYSNDSE
jgi:proliferating cell nuclear antigen PCNA